MFRHYVVTSSFPSHNNSHSLPTTHTPLITSIYGSRIPTKYASSSSVWNRCNRIHNNSNMCVAMTPIQSFQSSSSIRFTEQSKIFIDFSEARDCIPRWTRGDARGINLLTIDYIVRTRQMPITFCAILRKEIYFTTHPNANVPKRVFINFMIEVRSHDIGLICSRI